MGNRRIWTTKHGEKIQIRKLTNEHLKNIVLYLERRAKAEHHSTQLTYLEAPGPDMSWPPEQAASYIKEFQIVMASQWEEFLPSIYHDLKDELKRRQEMYVKARVSEMTSFQNDVEKLFEQVKRKRLRGLRRDMSW